MNENTCPKFEKCPIFVNNVFLSNRTGETYKNLYCIKGASRWETCKRYTVSNKTGKPVPENILPNSSLSVDEIIKKNN